jgi:hypothetical protein
VVRGIGIWDIRAVLKISSTTVLQVFTSMKYPIKAKQHQYDCLEIDEFWRCGGGKQDNVWLIPGKRGNGDRGRAERGLENDTKTEEETKRALDKL